MFKLNGQFIKGNWSPPVQKPHTPKSMTAQNFMKTEKEIEAQLDEAEGLLQTLSDMHSDCRTLVNQYFWERRKKRWESIF